MMGTLNSLFWLLVLTNVSASFMCLMNNIFHPYLDDFIMGVFGLYFCLFQE